MVQGPSQNLSALDHSLDLNSKQHLMALPWIIHALKAGEQNPKIPNTAHQANYSITHSARCRHESIRLYCCVRDNINGWLKNGSANTSLRSTPLTFHQRRKF